MTAVAASIPHLMSADQVADLLGISRATFYRLPFFRTRRIRVSLGRVVYDPRDVELYIAMQGRA